MWSCFSVSAFRSTLLFALATVSCSQAPSEPHIQGGDEDGSAPYVAQIETSQGEKHGLCSGVWIAPNAILTADHCARDMDLIEYLVPRGRHAGEIHEGRAVLLHDEPALCRGATAEACLRERYHDVAVVVFSKNLAPATVRLQDFLPEDAAKVSILGYGPTRCALQGERITFSDRKPARLKKNLDAATQRDVNRWISFRVMSPELLCHGDSGGPWIDEKTGGVFGVTAVNITFASGASKAFASSLASVSNALRGAISREGLRVSWISGEVARATPQPEIVPTPPLPSNNVLVAVPTRASAAADSPLRGQVEIPRPGRLTREAELKVVLRGGSPASRVRLLALDSRGSSELVAEGFVRLGTAETTLSLASLARTGSVRFRLEVLLGTALIGSGEFSARVDTP